MWAAAAPYLVDEYAAPAGVRHFVWDTTHDRPVNYKLDRSNTLSGVRRLRWRRDGGNQIGSHRIRSCPGHTVCTQRPAQGRRHRFSTNGIYFRDTPRRIGGRPLRRHHAAPGLNSDNNAFTKPGMIASGCFAAVAITLAPRGICIQTSTT